MSDTQPALNLYQKLAKITGEVGAIKKGGTNSEQKYSFIEYGAVAGELRNLFAKYNVIIVPYMQKAPKQARAEVTSKYGAKGEHVLIDFTFVVINADKPDEKFSVSWTGEALDYGDKATNKAATSALKYYLMRQFNISEQGEDPDADSPDLGTKAAPAPKAESAKPATPPPASAPIEKVTKSQLGMLFASMKGKGYEDQIQVKRILHNVCGEESLTDLTKRSATLLIDNVLKMTKAELDVFDYGEEDAA